MINLTASKQIQLNKNSSKGNQLKWTDRKNWYKADFLGYEALSEYVVSHLLYQTSVPGHVVYDLTMLSYQNKNYTGCMCKTFLQEDQEVITLEKLFRLQKNIDLTKVLAPMELDQRIMYVAEQVTQITGLAEFKSYLTMLIEMDAFFLNEDRHMNNIAVLRNPDKSFSYCPLFDNGASLFSDTHISYNMNMPLESCYESIEAKPFNRSFDKQVDAAEDLFGVHFSFWFTEKDIAEILKNASNFYSSQIIDRVFTVLRLQMRKYQYFRKKLQ